MQNNPNAIPNQGGQDGGPAHDKNNQQDQQNQNPNKQPGQDADIDKHNQDDQRVSPSRKPDDRLAPLPLS